MYFNYLCYVYQQFFRSTIEQYFIVYIQIIEPFIADEHLNYFQSEAVINKTAMNVLIQVFFVDVHFSFSQIHKYLGGGLLSHRIIVTLKNNAKWFFKLVVSLYTPIANA